MRDLNESVMQTITSDSLNSIIDKIESSNPPFYEEFDFYIFLVIGLFSLRLAWLAYSAAKGAKEAALEASKNVKIQSVTVELTEVSLKLYRIDNRISFFSARELLNEISRKIIRLLATVSYIKKDILRDKSKEIVEHLEQAKKALNDVKPTSIGIDEEIENESVYFAIEDYLFVLGTKIAELTGILENESLKIGD